MTPHYTILLKCFIIRKVLAKVLNPSLNFKNNYQERYLWGWLDEKSNLIPNRFVSVLHKATHTPPWWLRVCRTWRSENVLTSYNDKAKWRIRITLFSFPTGLYKQGSFVTVSFRLYIEFLISLFLPSTLLLEEMSVAVKTYLISSQGEPEIRRFAIDSDASTSFDYLLEKIRNVYPSLKRAVYKV